MNPPNELPLKIVTDMIQGVDCWMCEEKVDHMHGSPNKTYCKFCGMRMAFVHGRYVTWSGDLDCSKGPRCIPLL